MGESDEGPPEDDEQRGRLDTVVDVLLELLGLL
jgi:hypothetical protein